MVINRGQINTEFLTLSEATTIASPYYLFEFISKQTKQAVYCITQGVASIRGNEIQIEETNTPNPLLGQVTLLEGEYNFNVYQQASSTNLDPELTTPALFEKYVETGICDVPVSTTDTEEYNGAPTDNVIYNG